MTLPQSPEGKIYKSSLNLKERKIVYNYIRNSLVKVSDGELITLDDQYSEEAKNLMSYIKLLNLNPYSSNLNPYKNLPDNFMIYNSGFPLFKNNKTNTIELNKDNIGLNLRIYNVNNIDVGPIISYNYKVNSNSFLSNKVNNDIYFYNYIKNEIILKNICSHFPIIFAYFISSGKNNNLKKYFKNNLDKLISLKRDKLFQENNIKNNSIFSEIQKQVIEKVLIEANEYFDKVNEPKIEYTFYKIDLNNKNLTTNEFVYRLIIKENYDIKNNLLISLTEAPNLLIKDWFSNLYSYKDIKKNIRAMTNNGYHITEVWESILFQLYYTLMIMIIHGIKIDEFNLDNIFIKNISDNQKIYGYWIYDILGLKFYIKNYGYLLLIDSNFKNNISFNNNPDINFNKDNFNLIHDIFNKIKTEHNINEEANIFIDEIYSVMNITNFESKNLKIQLIKILIYLFGNKFFHNKLGEDVEESSNKKFKKPQSGDIIDYEGKYSIYFKIDNDIFVINKNNDELVVNPMVSEIEYNVYINLDQNINNDGSKFDLKLLLDTYVLK